MLGYRDRIEKAVKDMFELDRKNFGLIKKLEEASSDSIDLESNCDIALDLLGIPADTWTDIGYSYEDDPDSFCRDIFYDFWLRVVESADDFIEYCYEIIKRRADESEK